MDEFSGSQILDSIQLREFSQNSKECSVSDYPTPEIKHYSKTSTLKTSNINILPRL